MAIRPTGWSDDAGEAKIDYIVSLFDILAKGAHVTTSVLPFDSNRLLRGINWEGRDHCHVDIDLVQLLGAATLVESRGDSYGEYLARVFFDDPEFQTVVEHWSTEESEHGLALAAWFRNSRPEFDLETIFERYKKNVALSYQGSLDQNSIRGSKARELLSRCAVESGTSTYYKALGHRVDDRALKEICQRLSKDEIRHYAIFRQKLDEVRRTDRVTPYQLFRLSLQRLFEFEDDQVSYAYYTFRSTGGPYDKAYYSALMTRIAYRLYDKKRVTELIKLNLNALGLSKSRWINVFGYSRLVSGLATILFGYIRIRIRLLDTKIDIRRLRSVFS